MVGRKKLSLNQAFEALPDSVKQALAEERSPLLVGLAALAIAKEKSSVGALSIDEIVSALDAVGVAVKETAVRRAFARAGSRLSRSHIGNATRYKVMIPGVQLVKSIIGAGEVQVVLVQSGQPRTARKKLAEILSQLDGVVRISDPWYGERTLDALEMVHQHCEVRFLTAQTNEKPAKLGRAISDFKKERQNVELRVYPHPKELHDRYVLTDKHLLIVGHGIKDIGNKESFMIAIDDSYAPDLLESVRASFDVRWGKASAI